MDSTHLDNGANLAIETAGANVFAGKAVMRRTHLLDAGFGECCKVSLGQRVSSAYANDMTWLAT